MQHSYRRLILAVSIALAAVLISSGADGQGTQRRDEFTYIDIVMPFTVRNLGPAVISVVPVCAVGYRLDPNEKFHREFYAESTVMGEDRLSHLKKGEDGSYSGTFTVRLAVMVPPDAAGKPGEYLCRMGVRAIGRAQQVTLLEQPPTPAGGRRPPTGPFPLAPNTPDRVQGQFTW